MPNLYYSLILVVLFVSSCNSPAGEKAKAVTKNVPQIAWQDITTAKQAAQQSGKDIIVFVYAPWCPECKNLNTTTFADPEVIDKVNTHFIPVKFNAQESKDVTWEGQLYSNPNYDDSRTFEQKNSYHELIFDLGAPSIPSILVMDQSWGVLRSIQGYQDSNKFQWMLSNSSGRFDYTLKR